MGMATSGSAAQSASTLSVGGVLASATASGSGEITAGDNPSDEATADDSAKSRSKRITARKVRRKHYGKQQREMFLKWKKTTTTKIKAKWMKKSIVMKSNVK